MRASFIHLADTHLGYEQYGVRERFNDFSRAFWNIIDEAVARDVDFVLIAGDLFNKRAIDAQTLIHAIEGLKRLKDRNIPVIAIEGNHDRSYYRDGLSWLQFLCYQGYIILLTPVMQDGAPLLTPWQPQTMLGAYVDLLDGHLRIYGLPWQGSATVRSLEGMAQALATTRSEEEAQGIEYRLLAMHTGIDGIVARVQGLPTMGQLQVLQPYVDYLALGHVHKPYTFDGWIYNPGSTETCSAEESQWDDRGYYYVEIDTDEPERIIDVSSKERLHHAEHMRSRRRPFIRRDLRVEGLGTPEELYVRLEEYCRAEGPRHRDEDARPVVQIHLTGTLGFDVGSLDQARMEEMVRAYFQCLYVRIDNHTNDQDYVPDEGELDGRDRASWHELERRIFEELIGRDNRYLITKEQWGAVLAELKQRSLDKDDPEQIARFLREKRAALQSAQIGS
ncbi:exonuclease SbcCD subunit D [Ktedonosporobacter rubrisoli]|uniref:Nuclease SbcCD subunit D n=1 Tax=Ktedonosporobacter rubrisoli TaxID=2509675 RepID=A0A4P6JY40_KTERU|nr:exonuclease SbcCD subunit D [Ktedonosporobacter rubrisoli]QBD80594.1 exonuclease SbcCD subunit D [Ktedonosporobacter rubrisoli]